MKRVGSVLLSLMLLLSLIAATMMGVSAETAGDFTYDITADGVTVTGYNGTQTELTVPSTLGGYTVTAIGLNVFAGSLLTSVTLPDGVVLIDECAFEGCAALERVTVGAALKTVGYSAFYGCDALSDIYYGGSESRFESITVFDGNDPWLAATLHATQTAVQTVSLLPQNEYEFWRMPTNGYDIAVTAEGTGYAFSSQGSWPSAATQRSESEFVTVDSREEIYLNYDFTVRSGATNIVVYFSGQDPFEEAAVGTYVTLNGLVDPSLVSPSGVITDLGPGTYQGSVRVSDLGCNKDLIVDGCMTFSDIKIFAVGGTTVLRELSVGAKSTFENGADGIIREKTESLLPDDGADFILESAGGGSMGIGYFADGGYGFVSDGGWPFAYTKKSKDEYVTVDADNEDMYLYYDFEVVWGATNIYLYFNGQDPVAQTIPLGSFVSVNTLIDPNLMAPDGSIYDLGVGRYQGYIKASDLGPEGEFTISDIKIFAVDGIVEVYELSVVTAKSDKALTGDLNANGTVDMFDALALYSGVSGIGMLTEEQKAAADLNGDGIVDMFDALALYKTVSGQSFL